MLKSNKTNKPATKTVANALRDDRSKTKKILLPADKADKKLLTKKAESNVLSAKNVNARNVLIKTKSTPTIKRASDVNTKPQTNKKNVMNTIHNVTVASPPSSASKERRSASTSDIQKDAALVKPLNHVRSKTRTIPPEESILMKQKTVVKEPVAFEINFEEAKAQKPPKIEDDNEYDYKSDFESYESDFEPEMSSSSASSEKLSEPEEVNDFVENGKISNDLLNKGRIDSGSFEMSTKKSLSAHYDSIDDTINSHDSGISYEDRRLLSPKVSEFYRRGAELMKKVTFDDLNFDIFETKPIPYETFMAVYGQNNMSQASTQSESLQGVSEVQTESILKTETWTQFPAKFTRAGLESVNSKLYHEEKLGVGEGNIEDCSANGDSDSLNLINNFSRTDGIITRKSQAIFDSRNLQRFVEKAALTIANVIDNQSKQQELNPSKISISRGFTHLKLSEIPTLHDTNVTKIYTNLNVNSFVLTIHKKKDSNLNLLCLWDVINTKRPIKIFSSWSDVKCIEVHENQRDIIVGGCNDGTICLWDVQEITEWRDEGQDSPIIKPCEIISLNYSTNNFTLDNVVALKSLPHREHKSSSMFSQAKTSQICSLHRSGAINIWTISSAENEKNEKPEMDFVDLKSRVKLIKHLTIDLNVSSKTIKKIVKPKSAFEKTRYYFENDLFSDKVLRELQEIDTNRLKATKSSFGDDEMTRFNDCAVSLNEILVSTDMNFIVAVSRLNFDDKTKKIFTNFSSFVSPTAIRIHPINQNILAVGQANGELKFMKLYDDEEFLSNLTTKSAQKQHNPNSFSDILSKSCAFQNIVEKDKKLYDQTQALNNLESDELKAFLVNEALSEQFYERTIKDNLKVPFDKNIFNFFEVSSGSVSSIEFNKTGELMFVLIGKRLRIFNCWANCEVEQQEKSNICDVKCVQGDNSSEYLILMTSDNEIHVNKLKR